jgi:hypothetical protein
VSRRLLVLVAAAVAMGGAARAATAATFVRSRTDMGTPIFWNSSCAFLQVDEAGSVDLPLDTVQAVLAQAISNWQSVTLDAGCSYLKIVTLPPAYLETRLDYTNVVKFRSGMFCRPADGNMNEICYSPAASAITTIFYTDAPGKGDDGAIQDADVQLNQINFTFMWIGHGTVPMLRPGTQESDLENTLTHELGHFQGLDHSCWDRSPPYTINPPIDNNGMPVPSCGDLNNLPLDEAQRIVQSTMYNYANAGETIKRMPKPDDIAGICSIYPVAKDPKVCRPASHGGSGCSMAAGPAGAAPLLLVGLLFALAALRLRGRACSRSRRP